METRTVREPRHLSFKFLLALALALGAAGGVHAQRQQGAQAAAAPKSSQAPPQTKQSSPQPSFSSLAAKTVAFITVPLKVSPGAKPTGVTGTCFFVDIPDDRLGKDRSFVYLVTNRHVAVAEGAPPSTILPLVYVRSNLVQPQNGQAAINITTPLSAVQHWYFPTDPTIDLAVLPVVLNPQTQQTIDMKLVPVSMFATDEVIKSQSVSLGDPVFFLGYFAEFPGLLRADPIYRSGVLAETPVDPIPMRDNPADDSKRTLEHLWLADVHAFLGNSGSPLFISLGGMRNGVVSLGVSDYLLGVVNGFIPEVGGMVTGAATFEEAARHDLPNSGVLTLVPAQKLRDLLYDPELQKLRDEAVAAQQKN